jgi:hypothetical protein
MSALPTKSVHFHTRCRSVYRRRASAEGQIQKRKMIMPQVCAPRSILKRFPLKMTFTYY